ncbi:LPS assembly lipoprotein LptE [Parasediminibacterium paludis]|uniref:LPS assembly lipoprotein LptE n=1 Tax=Parasediminibacterium paludis TaxID=908966 RepID=A0ABV8PXE0_9BACT
MKNLKKHNPYTLSTYFLLSLLIINFSLLISSCGVYKFNDASIDYSKYKTIKINFIENRAPIINTQLAPKLNDKLQQKIVSQTRLTRTSDDNAHYQLSGFISTYNVTTAAISSTQAATNRLTVGVHMVVKDILENKTDEFDVSRNFDFSANLSIDQAYVQLQDEIIRNLTDEIFNHIFSNW